jgi:superfamily II DNA or RNA helicase
LDSFSDASRNEGAVMSVDAKRICKISAGDLRPDLMLYTTDTVHEILLSAPGLLSAFPEQSAIAKEPWKSFSVQRATRGWAAIRAAFSNALDELPLTPEWEQRILDWLGKIAAGELAFRYWPRAPLFTRMISGAESSLVFSGPIHRGLDDSSHELRVELSGLEHERAASWFSNCYREGTDVTDEVAGCLQQSWAGTLITPREAYLKVLSEYFSEVLQGLDVDVDDNPLLDHLTEFQKEAYQYARTILRRFGGVFLADVVGLGKTYIAMALIHHLNRRYGESSVVVASPKVLPAWEELAREFRTEIATVSIGKLGDLHQYSDRQILVIDESHHFRNTGTGRYESIASWLRPAGAPSHRKVILLSATPQNNDVLDVKHQLALFPENYARLPFEAESLDEWFKDVRAQRANVASLLQHVVVRRTRGYVRRTFPNAVLRRRVAPGRYEEEPLRFPERKSGPEHCLRYSITAAYHGDIYERILQTLAALKYPLHGLGAYVRDDCADDPSIRGLRMAGQSMRGLYKVLLLKRLESSVVAFRNTLGRLVTRLEFARDQLKNGIVHVSQSRSRPDDDDEGDSGGGGGPVASAALFEPTLLKAVIEDLSQTRSLEALVRDLGPDEDAKLDRLKLYLSERPPTKHRTIIFSQFADTAEYLGEQLRTGHGCVHVVTGSRGGALGAARRFAPRANRVDVAPEDQIDLLISTDVLSEGVNLQDADTLINYDLHWNPVRLIQRAGRIDRIGSTNEEIHISSFLPERELEQGLGLEEVLRRRIGEFIRVFGEDSTILPGEERLDEASMTDAYSGSALRQSDDSDAELDALNLHLSRILKLRREQPDEFASIVALRQGRRAASESQAPGVVATRLGRTQGASTFLRPCAKKPCRWVSNARDEPAAACRDSDGARNVPPDGGHTQGATTTAETQCGGSLRSRSARILSANMSRNEKALGYRADPLGEGRSGSGPVDTARPGVAEGQI